METAQCTGVLCMKCWGPDVVWENRGGIDNYQPRHDIQSQSRSQSTAANIDRHQSIWNCLAPAPVSTQVPTSSSLLIIENSSNFTSISLISLFLHQAICSRTLREGRTVGRQPRLKIPRSRPASPLQGGGATGGELKLVISDDLSQVPCRGPFGTTVRSELLLIGSLL
ncbi:uncharacterized protein EI97DRAFT_312590 [Westerdykella ornata]|uniref:Uncharacterized protein n=1 Tax=Westerdykella ornata TaxID=318751 RepID=A0A6A6JKL1_WESOR|nr:uncharacterized protein EI97DRAFT_312590 [Westerdykella ornata]KAF2277190.1 hypothetical protein EI97DRAFT_312590 [Westerdykella ornata]